MGKRFALIVLALAACSSATSHSAPTTKPPAKPATKLGATVIIDNGNGITAAGNTRSDLDALTKALAANDTVGITQLEDSGRVVPIDECATAILLDTAAGGERQVRITADTLRFGGKSPVGQALWVDVAWLKKDGATCP